MAAQLPSQRIEIVNALRAFAALFVAWGHFVAGQGKWLGLSGWYGYTGVHIFFVISGFIIPYSLYRSRYTLRNFGRFVLKRCLRLYPPYVVSIGIMIVATNVFMVRIFHIPGLHITGNLLLYHLFYLNDLVGAPWINVVYWTLAIEFQWYLVAGLLFPLYASRRPALQFCGVGLATLSYFLVHNDKLVFHSLPIFLVGVFVFQYKAGLISRERMLGLIAVMVWAMRGPIGWIVAGVSLATALLIAFVEFRNRVADFLGDVSYSVYLLHLPIGVTVIGFLSKHLPYSGSYIGLLDAVGIAASVGGAALLYRFVEKPSQEMSSRIRFVRATPRPKLEPVAAAAD